LVGNWIEMGDKAIPNPTEREVDDEPSIEHEDTPTKPRKSWRFWVAFVFLFLCSFVSSIDATILGTALPQIADDLNGTSILTFWCATAFFLAKTVVQPGIVFIKASKRQYGVASLKYLVGKQSFSL
jgi:hypothetical protein